jgi:hypothetical protein
MSDIKKLEYVFKQSKKTYLIIFFVCFLATLMMGFILFQALLASGGILSSNTFSEVLSVWITVLLLATQSTRETLTIAILNNKLTIFKKVFLLKTSIYEVMLLERIR